MLYSLYAHLFTLRKGFSTELKIRCSIILWDLSQKYGAIYAVENTLLHWVYFIIKAN